MVLDQNLVDSNLVSNFNKFSTCHTLSINHQSIYYISSFGFYFSSIYIKENLVQILSKDMLMLKQ